MENSTLQGKSILISFSPIIVFLKSIFRLEPTVFHLLMILFVFVNELFSEFIVIPFMKRQGLIHEEQEQIFQFEIPLDLPNE
jgi:hypothetical protein